MTSRVSIELCRGVRRGLQGDPAFDLSGLRTPLDSSYTVARSGATCSGLLTGVNPELASRQQSTGRSEVDKGDNGNY
jgi:hypothetical protein